jgi:hypothetical protein
MDLSAEELEKEGGGLSPEERAVKLKEVLAGYDGEALARSANQFSKLVMTVHLEHPELAEELFPVIDAALSGTDFGKARESVIALLDYWTSVTAKVIEDALENPVIVANIVGMVPPLVNSLIKVLSAILSNLELPPEILASAIFNVLSALDAEELGRALSLLSERINQLHAGNLILGGDEPRARAVTSDIARRLFDNLDADAFTDMLVALGEDAEVIAGALVELISRDPELTDAVARALVGLTNSATRIMSNALNEAANWPVEVLARLGKDGLDLDALEIGRAIDSFETYALRLREANPGLHREMYTRILQPVDIERVEKHLRAVGGDLAAAVGAHQGIRQALEPEEVGRRINEMLAGFNRSAEPAAVRDYLGRLFAALDAAELEEALKSVAGGVVDALFAGAATGRSVLKVAVSSAFRFIKNMVGLIGRRVRS